MNWIVNLNDDHLLGVDLGFGGATIALLLITMVSYCYARWGQIDTCCCRPVSNQGDNDDYPKCDCCGIVFVYFTFTRYEHVLLLVVLFVELSFFIWSIVRLDDDIYIDNTIYNSEYDPISSRSFLAKFAVFLRLIELQTILLWTLREQRAKPSHCYVLVRLISMVSSFVAGITLIVLSINENLRTIARILIGISIVNGLVCLWAFCKCCTNDKKDDKKDDREGDNNDIFTSSLSTSQNTKRGKKCRNMIVGFILFVIFVESILTCVILWIRNEDSKTMNRIIYDAFYGIDRIKILILVSLVLFFTIATQKKNDNSSGHGIELTPQSHNERSKYPNPAEIFKEYLNISDSKKEHSSSLDSITTTVMGYTQVGKTMYIRALWKFTNYQKDLKYLSDRNIPQDKYIHLEELPDNFDNFIDYYCRWEKNLQTSFSFWDTIGYPGKNYNKLAFKCLQDCDVAIIMYDLSKCIEFKDRPEETWWKKVGSLRYLKDLDSSVCSC